jgi:polyhydroxyalkanoate synthesis regulator phasin
MNKRTWLLGAAGAIAVLIVAATAGFAATGGGTSDGPSFLDRVAQKLGIQTDTLQQAVRDARSDEIDDAVARGDLTQEQAGRLKERLDQAPLDGDFGFGFGRGHGHGPGGPAFGLKAGIDVLAAFLGIDASQLRDEVTADGATLASVAEAHGKTRDALKAFLQQKADDRIDAAVEDGKITDEQGSDAKSKVSDHLHQLIDAQLPRFKWDAFPGRGPFGPHPHDDEAPAPGSSSNSSFRF